MKLWILRWGPAVIVIGMIFVASSMPGSDLPNLGHIDYLVKKGGHLLGYALLGAAFLHALGGPGPTRRAGLAKAVLLVILYAFLDEWHQRFTPGRAPSLVDVGIDTVGGLIGIAFFRLMSGRFQKRKLERKP